MKNYLCLIVLVLVSILIAGCNVTTTPVVVPTEPIITNEDADQFPTGKDVTRRALVYGLTAVDPKAYGGWDGNCDGCDIDANIMSGLFKEHAIETTLLLNDKATTTNIINESMRLTKGMKAGDLFIFYGSGHGGQVTDVDGDEEDGQDETLCLWDGQMSDDILKQLWDKIPAGVRVVFITDTCNSGTNYRARNIAKTIPKTFAGSMIHFGGCADSKYSLGSKQGGVFTTALIDAWKEGNSWKNWYNKSLKYMPAEQKPIWAEYGTVGREFRYGRALK